MPLLTDVMIRQAKVPRDGRAELWDSKVTGLLLRITPNGVRSWSVSYRFHGAKRRLTLGRYRAEEARGLGLTLGEARKRARSALRDVDDGRDPEAERVEAKRVAQAEERRAGASLADVAEKWLASRAAAEWRPKTRGEFERLVRREIIPALGDLPPEAVTKAHIRGFYDRLEARSVSVAKHSLAVLRLLYSWASEEDHVDSVPVFPKRGTQSNRRTRVLEEDELRRFWSALDAGVGPLTEAFRLMALTAQRRGEVLSMRWADVREERAGVWWTIPAARSKGGRDHRVPLTQPAVEALARRHAVTGSFEYVFPAPRAEAKVPWVGNPQKAAHRLWTASGLKGSAHVHDLRRTAATFMVRLGVPRLVVARVLGHADSDVTGRYDIHAYDREKRAALERWGAELQRIVSSTGRRRSRKVLPWTRA